MNKKLFSWNWQWLGCGLALLGLAWCGAGSATAQVPFTVPNQPNWQWQAPKPMPCYYTDLDVVNDQTAVVVGLAGGAAKTTDQGATWQQLHLGMNYDLMGVSFVSPLVGWVAYTRPFGLGNARGEVRKTVDGGLTWAVQPTGGEPDYVEMQAVHFFTASQGYVFYYWNAPSYGRPARLRTTANGGQTWQSAPVPADANGVQFITPLLGYVTCNSSVQKTTDGGLTYTAITPNAPGIVFQTMFFLNAREGWVAGIFNGPNPNFFHTTNGGQTWTAVSVYPPGTGTYSAIYNLHFSDPLHGTADGYATADGGLTWALVPDMRGVCFRKVLPSGVGFYANIYGDLGTTTDFGTTARWYDPTRPNGTVRQVVVNDPVTGWAATGPHPSSGPGVESVFRTQNRGQQWQRLAIAGTAPGVGWATAQLTTGAFPDQDTAYVAGLEWAGTTGTAFVLKTVDGGQNWQRLPLTGASSATDLQFREARFGLLVGDAGAVWYTRDAGQSWQRGSSGTTQNLTNVAWATTRTAYVRGDNGTFLKTTDGGQTWQSLPSAFFLTYPGHKKLRFINAQLGFVSEDSGLVFRTTDGGLTWAVAPGNVGGITSTSFTSARSGWAYGNGAYWTGDAGLTWTQQLGSLGTIQYDGTFIDRYNGWTGGERGSILHYSEKFITAAPLAQTTHCAGGSLALAFDTTGQFPANERRFKAELSNARGRFRPGQIRVVGQGTASPLAVALPFDLPAGTAYRLRVVQADSLVLGADTGQDLTLNAVPAATLTPAGPQLLCAGRSLTLTAPAGLAQYLWSTGATTRTLAVSAAGAYTVRVAGAGGCFGPPSAAVAVSVVPLPAAPVLAYAPGGPVTVAAPVTGLTYQWFVNGTLQAGVSGPRCPASGPAAVGTYTALAVSATGGCLSAASTAVLVVLAVREALPPGWALYPVPADDRLSLELAPGTGPVQLTLLDALGRAVQTTTTSTTRATLDVRNLPNGTYTLRAQTRAGVLTQQVVVQH